MSTGTTPKSNSSSLDWPLDGINLVEAAAGTGKTYNIETLVLRLLLERQLPITSLLVVTFTEAAAAELRTRIRKLLLNSFDAIANNQPCQDDRIPRLLRRAEENGTEPLPLIRRALTDFDDAVISTIHGFCTRVLNENAFESGVRFHCTVESDCDALIRQCALDFYRKHFYHPAHAALVAALAESLRLTLNSLEQVAGHRIKRETLSFCSTVPLREGETLDELLDELVRLFNDVRSLPEQLPVESCAGFLNKPFRAEDFTEHNRILGIFRQTGEISPQLLETILIFRRDSIEEKLHKIKGQPDRLAAALDTPEMRKLDELVRTIQRFKTLFLQTGAEFAARRVEELKREHNTITFDDMPRLVRDALEEPGSPLTRQLREKFSAGIIDEFQDTDPVQYRIFQKLFIEAEPQKTLFLVGDPRQAIYFFRGGDLATYLRAREDVAADRVYSLDTNYRSSPGMIRAVNRIFGKEHNAPFAVSPELLTLPEIHAPGEEEKAPGAVSPLRICRAPELNAENWPKYCAEAAVRLLNDPAVTIPNPKKEKEVRQLLPADIAILIRNRFEAAAITRALRKHGIPCVFTRSSSIYSSQEAKELLTFLQGVADAGNPRLIMNALTTPLGDGSVSLLLQLNQPEGEPRRLELQKKFRELADCWCRESFLKMFNDLLRKFNVAQRLLASAGGERQLSNFLQLGDLLQQESFRRGLGMNALLRFLAGKIADPGEKQPPDEELQQLETERSAVKLMTLHGSKGLEFPVVLLPTLWLCRATQDRMPRSPYHNRQGELEYDLWDSAEAKRTEKNERMQEQLRLAYVALTRAKYRCVLFSGFSSPRQKEDSPLEWLFRMKNAGAGELADTAAATNARRSIPMEIPPEMAEPLPTLTRTIYHPAAEPPPKLILPEWKNAITPNWVCASYSKLKPADDTPVPPLESPAADYDDELPGEESADEPPDGTGPFLLPGGKEAGNAIHKTLELLDFAAGREAVRRAVTPQLEIHGLLRDPARRETMIAAATELICNALSSPLPAGDGSTFTLAEIPVEKRLSELEFTYAFHRAFTTGDLKRLLAGFLRERFGTVEYPEWERTVSGGFLNGLIDLVFEHRGRFYIVDWKTNRAGNDLANFTPERLRNEMWHTFYFMQYLIYTVAWVKYLRHRLGTFGEAEYRDRFGGVFYLFLRGLSPEAPGRGVYFDKPEFRLIRELEAVIG